MGTELRRLILVSVAWEGVQDRTAASSAIAPPSPSGKNYQLFHLPSTEIAMQIGADLSAGTVGWKVPYSGTSILLELSTIGVGLYEYTIYKCITGIYVNKIMTCI